MIDISLAVALIALFWTIYQQYSIQKLCANCPFRKQAQEKEKINAPQAFI